MDQPPWGPSSDSYVFDPYGAERVQEKPWPTIEEKNMCAGFIQILHKYHLINETFDINQIASAKVDSTTMRKTLYDYLEKYKLDNTWVFERANTVNEVAKLQIAKVASDLQILLLVNIPDPTERPSGPEANTNNIVWANHESKRYSPWL